MPFAGSSTADLLDRADELRKARKENG